jgi:hypothetical protein
MMGQVAGERVSDQPGGDRVFLSEAAYTLVRMGIFLVLGSGVLPEGQHLEQAL